MLVVKHNIGLAVAVFNDIYYKVIDDFRIDRTDFVICVSILFGKLRSHCILTVFSEIRDNIGYSYNCALKSGWHKLVCKRSVAVALLNYFVEFLEALEV